jgi:hypothetical protein
VARDVAVEPSTVDFFIGLDSDDHRLTGGFRVVGERRVLPSAHRAFLSEARIGDV